MFNTLAHFNQKLWGHCFPFKNKQHLVPLRNILCGHVRQQAVLYIEFETNGKEEKNSEEYLVNSIADLL